MFSYHGKKITKCNHRGKRSWAYIYRENINKFITYFMMLKRFITRSSVVLFKFSVVVPTSNTKKGINKDPTSFGI